MKIGVMFHRLGPYHRARLKGASAYADIVALELSAVDPTYAWSAIDTDDTFERVTVFEHEDILGMPAQRVRDQVYAVLDRVRPDVLAVPGWSINGAFAAMLWAIQNDTPAILMSETTAHDAPRNWHKEWFKQQYARLCQAALVGGQPHVSYLSQLGMPQHAIFQGYDVIDNAYFHQHAQHARHNADHLRTKHLLPTHYFLASNRFIPKKNLPRLIDAYASYRQQLGSTAWDLVLLGDGPLKAELVAQVKRLGLTDQVHFAGFQQYDVLPVYYGLAEAFVHASTVEQWGLVVNEAMASGLPVVVSDRCGCALDLVVAGENGYVFDPWDEGSLVAALCRVTAGDGGAMGAASARIIQHWTPQRFGQNLLMAAQHAQTIGGKRKGKLAAHMLLQSLLRWQ